MDKALKTKWVEALCSGEYKQGRRQLKNTKGKYCCLGVLREVSGWGSPNRSYLSEKKMGFAKQAALAMLNDHGVPFEMIAGLINETDI